MTEREFRERLKQWNRWMSVLTSSETFTDIRAPTPTFAALVLKHGRFYSPQPRKKGMRRGSAKACFHNAWRFAADHAGYRYVEGFVCVPMPIHHAFVVDAAGAYELTLPEPVPLYFGVEFKWSKLRDNGGMCAIGDERWNSPSEHAAAVKRFTDARL